ncbi:hypothetical protein DBR11_20895 [Pedobacter sp. HMWF019]|uniref:hypothetical protein n=1 Tax=Pedobacter sp. HMWF019 TaxID=2056856 RepID=UPI000D38BA34|nr:hypothetical protein [Pedobacter sp. HMWF019]PTS95639.1 hypothetical protein DBR11_20895 [Pedobacter sp. HMWF019]
MQNNNTVAIEINTNNQLINSLVDMVEKHLIQRKDPRITLFYLYELLHTKGNIESKLARLAQINTDEKLKTTLRILFYKSDNQKYLTDTFCNAQFNAALSTILQREEAIGHRNVDPPEDFPFKVLNQQEQKQLVEKEIQNGKHNHLYRICFKQWKDAEELRQYRLEFVDLYNYLWEIQYIHTQKVALTWYEFIHTHLAVLHPRQVEKLSILKLHTPQANEIQDNDMMYFFGDKEIFTIMNHMIKEILKAPLHIDHKENTQEIPQRWPYIETVLNSSPFNKDYITHHEQTFLDIICKLSTRLYQKNQLIGLPSIETIFCS